MQSSHALIIMAAFWGVYAYYVLPYIANAVTQFAGGYLGFLGGFASVVVYVVSFIPGVWATKKYLKKYDRGTK